MAQVATTSTETEEKLRQKIAEGSQQPDDYRNLTELLLPSGRYDEGIALYKQALNLPLLTTSKRAQLLMEIGWLQYDVGQRSQATDSARDALALLANEPRNAEVLYFLGASQALLAFCVPFDDTNAGADAARVALEWLDQALADSSNFEDKPAAHIDAARLHNFLGNWNQAIAHCESCLQAKTSEPQRISCLIVYAQALRPAERFTEAEKAIAELFQYGSNYKSGLLSRLHSELGQIQRSTNRLHESKESFEKALEALRSDPCFHDDVEALGEIFFGLGSVRYELAEYKEAIVAYREVLRRDKKEASSYWTALYWLGRSHDTAEEHSEARDCYAEVLDSPRALEDDKALARRDLMWVQGKLDYESTKYKDAAAAFEKVLSHYTKEEPDYWAAILWLGSCHEGLGAYDKARALYEKVLNSPHASGANKTIAKKSLARSLAKLFYESARYEEAATKYEEVLGHYSETDPDHWNTLLWLGSSYQGSGSCVKEQDCYRKILASRHAADADRNLARKKLTSSFGRDYYESGRYAEAIATFEEVLASCSKDDSHRCHALVWLGFSYLATRVYSRARDCFEEVLASSLASELEKGSARRGVALLPTD